MRTLLSATLGMAMTALVGLPGIGPAHATDVASKDRDAVISPVTPAARVSGKGFGAFLAARQARKDGDIAAAAHYFNEALTADPGNIWLLRRAFLLTVSEGEVTAALPLAIRILEGDEQAPVANLTVAVDDLKNGRYGKAESRISKANKRRGSMRLVGPLLRAWASYGKGDGAEAAQRLDMLNKTEAFAPFANYHRTLILAAAGDLDAALTAFAAYEEGTRPDLRSMLVKAAIIEMRDGAEAGRAALETLRRRFGEDHVLVAYLNGERALSEAFPIRDANDGVAEALYGAASALVRDNVSDVAMIYLRLSLHVRGDLDVAQALLGDIRESGDRWLEAIAAYEGVANESPYKWGAKLRTAWMLDKLDRTDQAIELLQRMAAERQKETVALITLADLLRTHSRFEEAATIYSQAIDRIDELGPRHWAVLYARGIALERSGRWTDAEQDLLQALELRPKHPYIMNYLAYSWADKGVKLDEAVEMLRQAVALRPQDGYIIDSLGWVLFRKGEHEEAVKQLERAVELRPEDPTINEHLGDAYWHVGRRLESCFQWRRVLVLEPLEGQVETVGVKLKEGLPTGKGGASFRGCT
ncbi:MAG: tetratricopeptide repeat protein [Minwuia sp.]|nr:tetratricopeptide repeat protein [Minwuia sp.]